MPTISGAVPRIPPAPAEGRRRARCPSAAIEAIIAEVVRARLLLGNGGVHAGLLRVGVQDGNGLPPLRRVDADEVVSSSRARGRATPLPISVSNRITRAGGFGARGVERGSITAGEVVAVHALHVPAERRPFCRPAARSPDSPSARAVGLLVVDVDQARSGCRAGDARRPSPLPRSSLRRARRRTCCCRRRPVLLRLSPRRHAHCRSPGPPPSEPPEISMPGGSSPCRTWAGGRPAAVGLQFAFGQHTGFDQRRVVRDGVKWPCEEGSGRGPPTRGRRAAQPQRMAVGHGCYVGIAERLPM